MTIQSINTYMPADNTPSKASSPINPEDVAAFQSMVSGVPAAQAATPDPAHAASLADFYKQAQYDIVNMCVQYIPTFRD